ncbi:MAG: thiopurine S-methyltransferase [Pseudomonadota bacterium]
MDHDFWHSRWEANQIGFHQPKPNALMEAHLSQLALSPESRVFLPLCGKTLDLTWLVANGYRVVGAELSELAIKQLFEELEIVPDVSEIGQLKRYSVPRMEVFVGDIFNLDRATLGPVDAVYDRAALVALPDGMRGQYARHLVEITATAPQFLLTFTYDQSVMPGPPFSIDAAEVNRHYDAIFDISKLASADVKGGLKGICPAIETAWKLKPRA